MDLELPFPPSINHLWRRVGHRTLLSRSGRAYRKAVHAALAVKGVQPIAGRLAVTIDVHPPDRRRRDLDNALKALLDALQHGGVYHDDSQIDDLRIRRRACAPGGRICVRVVPLGNDEFTAEEQVEPSQEVPGGSKPRSCLKCGKTFDSSGPGNRICPPCQRANARVVLDNSELDKQRGAKRHNGRIMPLDLEAMS